MLKKLRDRPIMHGFWVLLVLIVPAFVQMCGRDSMSPESALRMVNGSIPPADHPAAWSAVALVDKSGVEHFCSGTIIAENLVVTAAHCVFEKKPGEFLVMFGRDTKDGKSVFRDVEATETFKKFQKFESNFDIAWVRFKGGLPSGFKPIEIWHQPNALDAEVPLTIAGYGRTASQCPPTDLSCAGGKLLYVNTVVREFVNRGRLFNLIVIGPRKDHGPCFGDSGGPAYLQKDGQWYVVGNFMGWDRILVSEQLDTICDSGEAIYNFVGDFVAWIEDTSGVKLDYNAATNPWRQTQPLEILSQEPNDFQGWCKYNNHEDPAWFAMQRLIRLASDFRIQSGDPSGARELFQDCQIAEEWLRKMLAAQPSLTIAGFDPANFIDSARLEDIRPFRVLGDMGLQELTLTDHSIADLSPLAGLKSLKKLEIIDNVIQDRQALVGKTSLAIASFPQLETLHLQNAGALIDFTGLSGLTKLNSLDLSFMDVNSLKGVDRMPLQNLRIDTINTTEAIDLSRLVDLQVLYLNKLAVLGMPDKLASLESMDLLDLRGLTGFPSEAPRLKRLFVYKADLKGTVRLGSWPALEEASFYSNKAISVIGGLAQLPKLRFLDISENNLLSLEPMYDLPALESLTIVQNGLKALPALRQLPKLERLDVNSNQLATLQGLGELPELSYLNASRNPLQNLQGVQQLPNLQRLVLQNVKGQGLTVLTGMQDLPKLKELNLAKNSFTSVDEVMGFPQLEVLVLSDNFIEDVSSLKGLSKLQYLEVVNNPLKKRTCPVAKPDACRFEWMNLSGRGPISFPGSSNVLKSESLQEKKPFGML